MTMTNTIGQWSITKTFHENIYTMFKNKVILQSTSWTDLSKTTNS